MDGSRFWLLKLDQDLIESLKSYFPKWNFATNSNCTTIVSDCNNNKLLINNISIHTFESKKPSSYLTTAQRKMSEGNVFRFLIMFHLKI